MVRQLVKLTQDKHGTVAIRQAVDPPRMQVLISRIYSLSATGVLNRDNHRILILQELLPSLCCVREDDA